MLISIGRRKASTDLVGLMLECHARIRHFAALSVRLATVETTAEDRAAAASSIARYFGEALPLHIRDEEESLLPRLRAHPELETPLDRMGLEHAAHDARLCELVTLARAIAADAGVFASHVERLRELAPELQRELESHLVHEEAEILPRIATLLDDEEQRAVISEMRARRA